MRKTLNLVNAKNSDIKYTITRFPDGEPHITITSELNHKDEVVVKTRICRPKDLFILLMIGDILDRHELIWHLEIFYLMSQRMDRVMDFNRPFSLKIVANLIKSMNFIDYWICTPHSERVCDLIGNDRSLLDMDEYLLSAERDTSATIVVPDHGAMERYEHLLWKESTINFEKNRDVATGKITGFSFTEPKEAFNTKAFMFIDDLCDGGGTFLGELEVLKKKYPDAKYSIYITHAVNEAGLRRLCEAFDEVLTTNSYAAWQFMINKPANLKVQEII